MGNMMMMAAMLHADLLHVPAWHCSGLLHLLLMHVQDKLHVRRSSSSSPQKQDPLAANFFVDGSTSPSAAACTDIHTGSWF
jgi:hypothetical protein